jgi:hypothetical protein
MVATNGVSELLLNDNFLHATPRYEGSPLPALARAARIG